MSNKIPPSVPPKKESPIKELSKDSIAGRMGFTYAASQSTEKPTPRTAPQSKKEEIADTPIASRSMASGEVPSAETPSEISQLKTQLEQQKVELERLNNIIDEAAEEALEHGELQKEHQDLKTAYNKFNALNDKLMQKLEKAIESNEFAYEDLELHKSLTEEKHFQAEDLKDKNTQLEKNLKESTRNITNLKSESDKLKIQIETLKTTNADLSKKNRTYLAESEAAAKQHLSIIGKQLSKKPELKNIAREKELTKQNKDLHKELEETRKELEELKRFKLADNKINESLKEKNLKLENESRKLSAKNTKQSAEIDKLKADIRTMRTKSEA